MLLLNLENIDAFYGSAQALKGINLSIEAKELLTILGANGSGKSTILKVISGILKPKAGKVEFEGRRIDPLSTDAIVKLGISQSPEGRRLFPELSVFKNLSLGAYVIRKDKAHTQEAMSGVFELFPVLRNRQQQLAGTMSGGEQQMLAIGRALMSRPKLLLLDEPSLGLAPLVVSKIFETIQRINVNGTAICLVEQNAAMAMGIAHRGYVLESGRVVLSGASEALRSDEKIRRAYLGI